MRSLFIVLFVFFFHISYAQQEKDIDLASSKIYDFKVNSGTVQLNLVNIIPKDNGYTYNVKTVSTDVLPTAPITSQFNATQTDKELKETDCPGSTAAANAINNVFAGVKSETNVANNFKEANEEIGKLKDVVCQKLAKQKLAEKDQMRRQKSFVEGMKPNQKIIVTIERVSKNGIVENVWEFTMRTESELDKWLIHYGFTYQPNIITKYDQFFSKAVPGTTDSYTITKSNANTNKYWQNVSPTLAFSHPLSKSYHDLMPAFTFITGTNFSTYSAGAGFSGIIAYNGLVSCGVMYTQKYALNGQYKEGDVIKENLNFDQLHTKQGGFELFITLSLRLDKNPFSTTTSSSTDKSKNPTTSSPSAGTSTSTSSSSTGTSHN